MVIKAVFTSMDTAGVNDYYDNDAVAGVYETVLCHNLKEGSSVGGETILVLKVDGFIYVDHVTNRSVTIVFNPTILNR